MPCRPVFVVLVVAAATICASATYRTIEQLNGANSGFSTPLFDCEHPAMALALPEPLTVMPAYIPFRLTINVWFPKTCRNTESRRGWFRVADARSKDRIVIPPAPVDEVIPIMEVPLNDVFTFSNELTYRPSILEPVAGTMVR